MIKLDIKGYGSMMIELDPIAAPKTVANFEALVEKAFSMASLSTESSKAS